MVELNEVVKYLDELLPLNGLEDNAINGLQVEGNATVTKVLFAVDACTMAFAKAAEMGCQLVVVHHGIYWKGQDTRVVGWRKPRIELLLRNNISLYASHLPLDRHKEIGNNVAILSTLGARVDQPLSPEPSIGWVGEVKKGLPLPEIVRRFEQAYGAKCQVLSFGKQDVRRIAVCSGRSSRSHLLEAIAKNCDVFITGEPTDVYHIAKETKINVIFMGHYASEIGGMISLAERVRKKFKLETNVVDIPTGL